MTQLGLTVPHKQLAKKMAEAQGTADFDKTLKKFILCKS